MVGLDTFVITQQTVGRDMVELLSEEEATCIETVYGEAVFQFLLNAPLMQAGSDASTAAPLFNCLEEENIVLLGVAFLDAQSGGWTQETRECITNIGLGHPDAIYLRLGLDLGRGPIDSEETLANNVLIHECLTDEEDKAFTVNLWKAVDNSAMATGADIIALLSEDELACVQEGLSENQYETMVSAQPLRAVSIGATVSHCIDPETTINIFTSGIEWALGGVTDDTKSCLEDFARQNPAFVALFASGLEGIEAMPAADFLLISSASEQQYACMTEDEILRIQQSVTAAMQQ